MKDAGIVFFSQDELKKMKDEMTKDIRKSINSQSSWVRSFSSRLKTKAREDEYIDLIDLREEDIQPKEKKLFAGSELDIYTDTEDLRKRSLRS